jgi:hypothetical protein
MTREGQMDVVVMDAAYDHATRTQFTTHSYACISIMRGDSSYLCEPGK